jgi:outer membrane cobalamin receptor
MRRRHDDWINATHILKAAGFDKPARTRILEREVQKEVHEKVQGGYGKYQGKMGNQTHGSWTRANEYRHLGSTGAWRDACT